MNTLSEDKKSDMMLASGSPEWCLLMATACLKLDDSGKDEIERILQFEIDWDRLIMNSAIHGTAGLLYKHLSGLSGVDARLPQEVIDRLRTIYLRTCAMGMQQIAQFKALAESAREKGIELIVLKGAALAQSLYRDPGLRPLSDIDIIVRERDWPQLYELLTQSGFSSPGQNSRKLPPKLTRYDIQAHVQFVSERETCLEFQFDLFTLGIGMRDMDGVWQRSREAEVGGARVRILSPEDQLLHLAVHANRHGCSRLKWLVDIAEILQRDGTLDWELMKEIARRESVTTSVYQTLEHVQRFLGRQLFPPEALAALSPRGYQRMLWQMVWPREELEEFRGRYEDAVSYYFFRPFSGWNLLNFVMMGRVRDKMAFQARWMFPSAAWMAETYNEPKSFRLLKYYPMRLAKRSRRKAAR